MPRYVNFPDRLDSVLEAMEDLVREGGVPALTLRAVAARARISPASLVQHFGGRAGLWERGARRWKQRRLEEMARVRPGASVGLLLPATVDELADARFELALAELGRDVPDVAAHVAAVRDDRRAMTRWLSGVVDETVLDVLAAALEGLRTAMVAAVDPVDPQRARAAALLALELCRGHRPPDGLTSAA